MAVNLAHDREWATACHEAGHAVVGHFLERRVRRVSIVPDRHGLTLGQTSSYGRVVDHARYWTSQRQVDTAVLALYAGVFAEQEITGRRHNWTGAALDLAKVADIALVQEGTDADAYLRWMRVKARRMVRVRRLQIEAVAETLIRERTLDASGFLAALSDSVAPVGHVLTFEVAR